jgi:CHRD domain-containing protein
MCAQSALAHHSRYTADLTGDAEFPPNSSAAIGHAVITIDFDILTMRVATTFSGLEGTVTTAHIHGPTAESGEGIADVMTQVPTFTGFPSGVTSGSYDHLFDLTDSASFNPAFITASGSVSQAMNALFDALHDGTAYLNIHTSAYGDGEIRGFLFQVPGDYNDNGIVDAADYVMWRKTEGDIGEGLQADSNNDNVINQDDYTEWRRLFGNDRHDGHHHGSGAGSLASIPETNTLVPAACALVALPLVVRLRLR